MLKIVVEQIIVERMENRELILRWDAAKIVKGSDYLALWRAKVVGHPFDSVSDWTAGRAKRCA